METELRKILTAVYKGQKENNDEAVERILLLLSVSKRISDLTIKYHAICEASGEFSMEAEKINKEILRLDDELSSLYVC